MSKTFWVTHIRVYLLEPMTYFHGAFGSTVRSVMMEIKTTDVK